MFHPSFFLVWLLCFLSVFDFDVLCNQNQQFRHFDKFYIENGHNSDFLGLNLPKTIENPKIFPSFCLSVWIYFYMDGGSAVIEFTPQVLEHF